MRLAKPHLFASVMLVSWACAKGNAPDPGADPYTPPASGRGGTSTRGGSGGGAALGSGGASAATGGTFAQSGGTSNAGTSAESGGTSTQGGRGSGGTQASGATGGTSPAGGRNGGGTGGSAPMAGRSSMGGTNAAGGVSNSGGNGAGGAHAMAGATNGGMGAAGLPNDPNWKPPDMTSFAKIVVYYQPQQTAKSATNIQMTLSLKNQTDTAYDLSKVTIRYWMSSEPPPKLSIYYSSTGLNLSGTPTFVPNNANSYINFSFGKGGTVPPYVDQNTLNSAQISAGAQAGVNNTNFDQSNDWSFDGTATAAKVNPKITVYDGSTLIWGCEPSHVCAQPPATTGEGGAGGQAAL